MIPPEAKISNSLIVGEVLDTTSVVRKSPTDNTIINPANHWRYTTIEHLATWGRYVDCWHTALRECNEPNGRDYVYNYIFMKGKGMVNFWYGQLVGTTVTGFQLYGVSY